MFGLRLPGHPFRPNKMFAERRFRSFAGLYITPNCCGSWGAGVATASTHIIQFGTARRNLLLSHTPQCFRRRHPRCPQSRPQARDRTDDD